MCICVSIINCVLTHTLLLPPSIQKIAIIFLFSMSQKKNGRKKFMYYMSRSNNCNVNITEKKKHGFC